MHHHQHGLFEPRSTKSIFPFFYLLGYMQAKDRQPRHVAQTNTHQSHQQPPCWSASVASPQRLLFCASSSSSRPWKPQAAGSNSTSEGSTCTNQGKRGGALLGWSNQSFDPAATNQTQTRRPNVNTPGGRAPGRASHPGAGPAPPPPACPPPARSEPGWWWYWVGGLVMDWTDVVGRGRPPTRTCALTDRSNHAR